MEEPTKEKQKKGPLVIETIYPEDKNVIVNTPVPIKVTVHDEWSKIYFDDPGAVIEVRISSPEATATILRVDPQVHSSPATGPGIYNMNFVPTIIGTYEAMCYYDGQPLQYKSTKFKVVAKKGHFW